jgi:hypothetical protein
LKTESKLGKKCPVNFESPDGKISSSQASGRTGSLTRADKNVSFPMGLAYCFIRID